MQGLGAMESRAPQVAVVIPSWNSADLLPRCLDSLAGQGEVKVIVVDNGSTDGTLELLGERGIEPIALPENRGFATAVDVGVERTQAPYVMPLNADTELEPGAVATLLAAMEADPGLGGVAPLILQVEGEARDVAGARVYSAGQGLTRDGRAIEHGAGEPQGPETARGGEVFGVCGAACLLRRQLFGELGGYDRSFFSFYEDVDLNVRARVAGWRFEYVPGAVVWHHGNASWQANAPRPSAWNARLVARNRLVTQLRFVEAGTFWRIAAVEFGAMFRAAREGRFLATLRGKLEGVRRFPRAVGERRRMAKAGDLDRARAWLGRTD
jgi:GT2 family glycosyltransferase